jgi:hypothetical protein
MFRDFPVSAEKSEGVIYGSVANHGVGWAEELTGKRLNVCPGLVSKSLGRAV